MKIQTNHTLAKKNLKAPLEIRLFLTNRCNLACKHCCTNVDLEDDELNFNEISKLIDQIKSLKIFSVRISGGEPFLREDVFEILGAFRRKKVHVASIFTNCTLMNNKIIRELKNLHPTEIRTSLDGSSPKIHDRLRGNGSFERTIEGIKRVKKEGFSTLVKTVVTKHNISDLPNIALIAKKLGFNKIEFIPVRLAGNAIHFLNELAPDEETYEAGPAIARELIEKYGPFASGTFMQIFQKIEYYKTLKREKNQSVSKIGLCPAGRTILAIRPDGVVIPCGPLWDLPAGSIREKPLLEIWKNSPVLHKFRAMDKISLDSIDECRRCSYKYFCDGGCRAHAYYFSGSIKGFCPDCNYFRKT